MTEKIPVGKTEGESAGGAVGEARNHKARGIHVALFEDPAECAVDKFDVRSEPAPDGISGSAAGAGRQKQRLGYRPGIDMTIRAKYEDGGLKPLDEVNLKESTVLEIYLPSGRQKRIVAESLPITGM